MEEFLFAMVNMGEKMTEEEVKEIIADSDVENNHIKIEEFAKMIMNRIWNKTHLFSILLQFIIWAVYIQTQLN